MCKILVQFTTEHQWFIISSCTAGLSRAYYDAHNHTLLSSHQSIKRLRHPQTWPWNKPDLCQLSQKTCLYMHGGIQHSTVKWINCGATRCPQAYLFRKEGDEVTLELRLNDVHHVAHLGRLTQRDEVIQSHHPLCIAPSLQVSRKSKTSVPSLPHPCKCQVSRKSKTSVPSLPDTVPPLQVLSVSIKEK